MTERQNPNPFADLEEEELQALWEKFYPRLKRVVAGRIEKIPSAVPDHSGIAASAIKSVILRIQGGEFPNLSDENELWKLLLTFAIRRANDQAKAFRTIKRGGHKTIGQVENKDGKIGGVNLAADVCDTFKEVEIEELFESLYEKLPNDMAKQVVSLRLEGATNKEISECLGTSIRNVQLTLKAVRENWERDILA